MPPHLYTSETPLLEYYASMGLDLDDTAIKAAIRSIRDNQVVNSQVVDSIEHVSVNTGLRP